MGITKDQREWYIDQLRMLKDSKDHEKNHVLADGLLMEILSELGYSDIVTEFKEVTRWCA